jgi:hypothetical protein
MPDALVQGRGTARREELLGCVLIRRASARTVIRGSRMHQYTVPPQLTSRAVRPLRGAWRAARSRFATARRSALQRYRAVRGLRHRTLGDRRARQLMARWRDGDGRYRRRGDQRAAYRRPGDRAPSAHRRSRGAPPASSRPGACRHPPRRRNGRPGGIPVTGHGGRVDRLAGVCVPRLLSRAAVGRYGSSRSPSMSCAFQRLEKFLQDTSSRPCSRRCNRHERARAAARTRAATARSLAPHCPSAGGRTRQSHALSLGKK